MKINKRLASNFFINPKFQYSVIGQVFLVQTVALGIIYFSIQRYFGAIIRDAVKAGVSESSVIMELITNLEKTMNHLILYVFVLISFVVFVGGIIISHRISGPLYRLNLYFRGLSKSNISPLKFRKNDYFPELQEAINIGLQNVTKQDE